MVRSLAEGKSLAKLLEKQKNIQFCPSYGHWIISAGDRVPLPNQACKENKHHAPGGKSQPPVCPL